MRPVLTAFALAVFSTFLLHPPFSSLHSAPAAGPPAAKPAEERYEVALLDGHRVGRVTTTVTRDKDGKQVRVVSVLELTLRRYGSVVKLRREEGTIETPEGRVRGVVMRQGQAGGKQLVLTGVVEDDKLLVKIDGGRIERKLRWPEGALGLRQQHQLFAARKPKAGDRFAFSRFEPTYNAVLTVRVEVKPRESVDVLGKKQSLLRVEMTPDKLEAPGQTVRPPKVTWWLDDDYLPVRKQTELDGLGTLVLVRATKAEAGAAAPAAPDVGARSLIALNKAIPRPYDTRSVLYKVTARGETDASSLLASDTHQEARNARGETFELLVRPARPNQGQASDKKAGAEYLARCHFIDHDDKRVQEMARRAVGRETDPWKKAVAIERYVKGVMRNDASAELAPASAIAKAPRGDCRHHAFLTAALCRASGLPSRTAIGLLYVYKGGPKLGFHTWAEVHVEGRWLGLDSTLGKGGVSGAHVKINDHSWHKVESLTPLLPASRVVGKLRVEVVKVEP
jgi:transglutaminase-like putative cysteine protease